MPPTLDLDQIGLDLLKQNGREIDHCPGLRIAFQMGSHVAVILDGMQVYPRKQELIGSHVQIGRLVHMPAKYYRRFCVRGHGDNPARASRA